MWVLLHRGAYIHVFPIKINCSRHILNRGAIVMPKKRLSSPDHNSGFTHSSSLGTAWNTQTVQDFEEENGGMEEDAMCGLRPWLSRALVRGQGANHCPLYSMALPALARTRLGWWKFIPTGYWLLGCCSGLCARQTLAFNPVEARV